VPLVGGSRVGVAIFERLAEAITPFETTIDCRICSVREMPTSHSRVLIDSLDWVLNPSYEISDRAKLSMTSSAQRMPRWLEIVKRSEVIRFGR